MEDNKSYSVNEFTSMWWSENTICTCLLDAKKRDITLQMFDTEQGRFIPLSDYSMARDVLIKVVMGWSHMTCNPDSVHIFSHRFSDEKIKKELEQMGNNSIAPSIKQSTASPGEIQEEYADLQRWPETFWGKVSCNMETPQDVAEFYATLPNPVGRRLEKDELSCYNKGI